MTRKYCDSCRREMSAKESGRLAQNGIVLPYSPHKLGVEIIHCFDGIWNGGDICWTCIREIVKEMNI